MSEKPQGISIKVLSIGSIVCLIVGLFFGLMALFPDEAGTYGILGMALICIGVIMSAMALLKRQAQKPPEAAQGTQGPNKS